MFRSLSGDRSVRRLFLFIKKGFPFHSRCADDKNAPSPLTKSHEGIPLNKQWSKGSAKKEKEKRYG